MLTPIEPIISPPASQGKRKKKERR